MQRLGISGRSCPNSQRTRMLAWFRRLSANWLQGSRVGLLVGAVVLAVGLSQYVDSVDELFGKIVIDDAYITYRYSENWASGIGPTWNRDDPPAEGYSTPLYMAFLAGARAVFGADIPKLSLVSCLVLGAGTLLLLAVLLFRATGELSWALAGAGILAAHPCLAVWSVGGMETAVYTFLILLSALLVLLFRDGPGRGRALALAAVLALVALTRTEGPLVALAFAGATLVTRSPERAPPGTWTVLAAVAGVVAVHLVVRRAYYGLWVPIPVLAKGSLFASQDRVTDFYESHWLYLVLWLPALLRPVPAAVQHVLRYSLVVAALLTAAVLQVDPVMSAFHRYLFPLVPLFLFGALVGLRSLGRWVNDKVAVLALVAVAALATGRDVVGASRDETMAAITHYSDGVMRSHVALGEFIATEYTDPHAQLVAADCGVLPYYSKLRVIDVFGLNDLHIAEHGLDLDYIFGRRPELIVTSPLRVDQPLLGDPRLRRDYTLVSQWPGFYTLSLYRRRDD